MTYHTSIQIDTFILQLKMGIICRWHIPLNDIISYIFIKFDMYLHNDFYFNYTIAISFVLKPCNN